MQLARLKTALPAAVGSTAPWQCAAIGQSTAPINPTIVVIEKNLEIFIDISCWKERWARPQPSPLSCLSGQSANTWSTDTGFIFFTSGVASMNHLSQAPPSPTRIATYCFPSTEKVIGGALTPPPVLNSQSFCSDLPSNAMTSPDGWPENTRSGVARMPPRLGKGSSALPAIFPVVTSIAVTLPVILKGWLGPPPVKKSRGLSLSFVSSSTVIRLQLSITGMYQSFRFGLYAVGGQFLPPILPGQMSVTFSWRFGVTA